MAGEHFHFGVAAYDTREDRPSLAEQRAFAELKQAVADLPAACRLGAKTAAFTRLQQALTCWMLAE